jgi:hypothetical protein
MFVYVTEDKLLLVLVLVLPVSGWIHGLILFYLGGVHDTGGVNPTNCAVRSLGVILSWISDIKFS